jgi:hypothetical protein
MEPLQAESYAHMIKLMLMMKEIKEEEVIEFLKPLIARKFGTTKEKLFKPLKEPNRFNNHFPVEGGF